MKVRDLLLTLALAAFIGLGPVARPAGASQSTVDLTDGIPKTKADREKLAYQVIDALDDDIANIPLNAWPALIPDVIIKPQVAELPLSIGQRIDLHMQREVIPATDEQRAFGKFAVRDTFKVYIEVGPMFQLQLPVQLSINAGVKFVVLKEWIAIHFVDDEKQGYIDGFWKHFGLPWQILKLRKLGQAFDMPLGAAIMETDYYDFTGRLALSISPLNLDFGGPRVDLSAFRSAAIVMYRESETTLRLIREQGSGHALRSYFPLYFVMFYLDVYDRDYVGGDYKRHAYSFDRAYADLPDEQLRFARVTGRKSPLQMTHPLASDSKDDIPQYSLDIKSHTRIFKSLAFLLWSLPARYEGDEKIQYTDAYGVTEQYAHAFQIVDAHKKRRSADLKIDLGQSGQTAAEAKDAALTVTLSYTGKNWKREDLDARTAFVNSLAGGEPMLDCDASREPRDRLGGQTVTLRVLLDLDAIGALRSATDEAACRAFEDGRTDSICGNAEVYKKHLPVFRFVGKDFARLHRVRSFIAFLRDLRTKPESASWAKEIVGFVSTRKAEPYLAAIVRLAGSRGVLLHAEVKTLRGHQPYHGCEQTTVRGGELVDEVFEQFDEPILQELVPVVPGDPHPTRIVPTAGEDQDTPGAAHTGPNSGPIEDAIYHSVFH